VLLNEDAGVFFGLGVARGPSTCWILVLKPSSKRLGETSPEVRHDDVPHKFVDL